MTVEELITDPTLRPLFTTSQTTLIQTLDILTWLSKTLGSQPDQEFQLTLSRLQKSLFSLLAQLRIQNRRAAFGVRSTKQETAEARQEVDRLLLQLQNLYYEQRHLMGEISACEIYDHAYTHLPLLSLEDYLQLFPDQANLPEQDLMPLRIEYEKHERERMEQERLELVKIRESHVKANTLKKEELRKMDEKLEAMIDSLKPLEEALSQDI